MSDIAIVGIGCRYAGGIDSPKSFWDFVVGKRDAVTEIPADRWDARRYYDPDRRAPGRMYTTRAAFLTTDPWAFDPDFFGISPREATAMDPQQRLILEVAWEALDDAGVAGRTGEAAVGVYVGAFTLDQLAVGLTGAAVPHIDMHSSAGTSYTMLSNRISYALNLGGPSVTVDTACSSSLVALHLACQALHNGDCRTALAGGVNLMLQPGTFISMCKGGFLAEDGRSKSFGASADGYGRGEGAGMVVLKPLADAERDGDRVYAVIKATGSNQDGRTTAITVPNAAAQEQLATSVCARAGIAPHEVTYVEAHGTGTPVGDPLELQAIGRAYGAVDGRTEPLGVGSVKATLGHTEAAAGIASVIKSALAIQHRTLPPQGWIDDELNPDLALDELRLRIQTEATELGPDAARMTVAVNGFGYGGTNAHAVLQEYRPTEPVERLPRRDLPLAAGAPALVRRTGAVSSTTGTTGTTPAAQAGEQQNTGSSVAADHPAESQTHTTPAPAPRAGDLTDTGQAKPAHDADGLPSPETSAAEERSRTQHAGVLPLSARGEQAVRELAGEYAELLETRVDLDHLAAAAWTRRHHHQFRLGVPFADRAELAAALRGLAGGEGRAPARTVTDTAPVFVFTGMGPQWWGMARDLLTTDAVFAAAAQRVDAAFTAVAEWSILAELAQPEQQSRVTATEVAQPANFLVQVALFDTLAAQGIHPAAVVGHSVGEVSAAYVTGALSLADAVTVAYHRARLQASTAGSGGMLAVGLPADDVAGLIGDSVDIAAINSPTAVTLSGDFDRLTAIAESLTERGVFAKRLQVEVPYHSALMDPIRDDLRSALAGITPQVPSIPLYSTVTGAAVTGPDWDADYWCANVREPVRFADAVRGLITAGERVFLEVGPHPVLGANIREMLLHIGQQGATVATLNRKQPDGLSMRHTIAGLYAAGALDIRALVGRAPAPHLPLPRYPWQRRRLRSDLPVFAQQRYGTPGLYTMLGDPGLDEDRHWTLQLAAATLPWLDDHVVDGSRILPGAAYLDAALSAAAVEYGSSAKYGIAAVENVRFVAPLVIESGDVPVLEVRVEQSTRRFTVRSRPALATTWTVHATGRLVDGAFEPVKITVPDTTVMPPVQPETLYADLAATGVEHGPAFRLVRRAWAAGDTVVATVDAAIADGSGHLAHPCVLDAAWQIVSLGDAGGPGTDGAVIPIGADSVRMFAPIPPHAVVVARLTAPLRADVTVLDSEHNLVLQIVNAKFQAVAFGGGLLRRLEELYYEEQWVLRDPIDRTALPPAHRAYTLVAPLDEGARGRVEQIVRSSGHAEPIELSALADGRDDAFLARLQAAHTTPDVDRVHVCVVAGAESDAVRDLWLLSRLALAVERFADEMNPEPLPLTGDGSIHVTLITERAFTHPEHAEAPNPEHAALAGARRVLLNEQPPLRWRLVDIEPETTLDELTAELAIPGAFSADGTDEVFLRNDLRWSTVVQRALPDRLAGLDQPEPLPDPEANFTLDIPRSRMLSQLGWRRSERRAPGHGEVEVRMAAIGLGFKDPLKVLGVLGEDDLAGTHFGTAPGMEGAGTVVRVGPDVTRVQVGDRVGLASAGMIERYHLASVDVVGPAADSIRPELCTSTVSMVTAEYALLDLARLRAGETVLVHGAAGGVGASVIQVAKLHGARVIGTASTDERRAYALAQGADEVLNSRSLNFADDVVALTGGRGADIVISTAPGEIVHQNFAAVAEFGRIVEVGKADIYSGGVLELRNFDKNVAYFSFDLDRMLALRRAEVIARVQAVNDKLADGTYRPLPFHSFGVDEVSTAFEEALRSTRLGRIALDLTGNEPPVRPQHADVPIDASGRYLITGGFGAFGLATARWLVRRGARQLVLVGRSGARSDAARAQLAAWECDGVEVLVERTDITDIAAVRAMIERVHTAEAPLRGVFHAAGVLDDQRITTMDRASLSAVFEPKLLGARALAEALTAAGVHPDLIVLYSSGSAIMGGVGQYSYTAANLALQAFAEQLARAGERVLCIGWGAMSGGGMVDADQNVQRYLRIAGFDAIDMDDGTAYLGEVLRLGVRQAAVIPVEWGKVVLAAPQLAYTARVAGLIAAASEDNSAAARLRAEISALEEAQRATVVGYLLAEQLAEVMGVAADSIDLSVPLPELGLDSLMAVEFGALVGKTLGVEMNSMQLGRSFSLAQAGARIADIIVGSEPAQAVPA
ncbi:polyketide synthase [Nocardia donostiensis]|uniref:type I polyketide synthase n=1 Tax=Nocardia donostiensis TaxID=1538463 RepID=UPI0009F0F290|nr:type I polyketide synthase [Nocardia donostiensis]OQS16864.1 polyketide synthase [Nocardia donostiensis]